MKARLAAMEAEAAKLREVGLLPLEMDLRPLLAALPPPQLQSYHETVCMLAANQGRPPDQRLCCAVSQECSRGFLMPPEQLVLEKPDAERRCREQKGAENGQRSDKCAGCSEQLQSATADASLAHNDAGSKGAS